MKNLICCVIVALFASVAQFDVRAMEGEQWTYEIIGSDLSDADSNSKLVGLKNGAWLAVNLSSGQIMECNGNAWNPVINDHVARRFNSCCYDGTKIYAFGADNGMQMRPFEFDFTMNDWQSAGELNALSDICSNGKGRVYLLNKLTGQLKTRENDGWHDIKQQLAPDGDPHTYYTPNLDSSFCYPCIANGGNTVYAIAIKGSTNASKLVKCNTAQNGSWEILFEMDGTPWKWICCDGTIIYAIMGRKLKMYNGMGGWDLLYDPRGQFFLEDVSVFEGTLYSTICKSSTRKRYVVRFIPPAHDEPAPPPVPSPSIGSI